ncbi:MAG: oxidoreductase [Eudoraea sp.]|nr:oxidoreductase [Eudoraea sp.]
MHRLILILILFVASCTDKQQQRIYESVEVTTVLEDSLSIRAIELMPGSLAFAANKGIFGTIDLETSSVRTGVQRYDTILPEFRAVGHTSSDFFMLSVASPALLYKTGDKGQMELVYTERDSLVFYDAMNFWNDREGLAVGDSMNGCLSIILTRDGGKTWNKLDCSSFPASEEGEGAFAASNSNIAIVGNHCWIASSASRVYYSSDKGKSWEVFLTPVVKETPTQGIYSIDFFDENIGIVAGGDYTSPKGNMRNMARTKDGGRTWELVADGQEPDYKSCVQFVPDSDGMGIVAVGFTGIAYSADGGSSWKELSPESFYTIRFLNDSVAYAAGRNRIAKLLFK